MESVESARNRRLRAQSERVRAKLQIAIEVALEYQREAFIYNEGFEDGAVEIAVMRVKQEVQKHILAWQADYAAKDATTE